MTSYYINKTASGLNDGTTWEDAWQSFNDVNWSLLNGGDSYLYISGGPSGLTYTETLNIEASGGLQTWNYILNGTDAGHSGQVTIDGEDVRRCVNVLNQTSTQIKNLKFIRGDIYFNDTDFLYLIDNDLTIGETTISGQSDIYGIHLDTVRNTHIIGNSIIQDSSSVANNSYGIYGNNVTRCDLSFNTITIQNTNTGYEAGAIYLVSQDSCWTHHNKIHLSSVSQVNSRFAVKFLDLYNSEPTYFDNCEFHSNELYANTNISGILLNVECTTTVGQLEIDCNTFVTEGGATPIYLKNVSGGVDILNNILFSSEDEILLYVDNSIIVSSNTNLFYNPGSLIVYYSGTSYSLADWLDNTGYDLLSFFSDPNFTNLSTQDFTLVSPSDAIHGGQFIKSSRIYDLRAYGILNKTTINQKDSTLGWDIGAYIRGSKDWYVDITASGLNSGETLINAWTGFSEIIWSNLIPGDRLLISGGELGKTYNELLDVGQSNITITTTSEPGIVTIDLQNLGTVAINVSTPNITLDGLTITGAINTLIRGGSQNILIVRNCNFIVTGSTGISFGGNGSIIENNIFTTTDGSELYLTVPIQASSASEYIIQDNDITTSNSHLLPTHYTGGIKCTNSEAGIIRNNKIHILDYKLNSYGVSFTNCSSLTQVYNNIIYSRFSGNHIFIESDGETTELNIYFNTFVQGGNADSSIININTLLSGKIQNNILYSGADGPAITISGWAQATSDINYNLVYMSSKYQYPVKYNNTLLNWSDWLKAGNDTNSLYEDPLFSDYKNLDFTLQSTSPIVGKGKYLESPYILDYNWNQRSNNGCDIGAYQYNLNTFREYFVSVIGDDNGQGDVVYPFKTPDIINTKWNNGDFNPGDKIYFKRGDIWYLSGVSIDNTRVGSVVSGVGDFITFDNYGDEALDLPEFNGCKFLDDSMNAVQLSNSTGIEIKNLKLKQWYKSGIVSNVQNKDTSINIKIDAVTIEEIGPSLDSSGIHIIGSDCYIINSTISKVWNNHIIAAGNNLEIGYNTLNYAGLGYYGNSFYLDDLVTNLHIYNNITSGYNLYGGVVTGQNNNLQTNNIFEYNNFTGGGHGIDFGGTDTNIYNNYFFNIFPNPDLNPTLEKGIAIKCIGFSTNVYNNIIYNVNTGIYLKATDSVSGIYNIYNNTIIDTDYAALEVQEDLGDITLGDIKNNLFYNIDNTPLNLRLDNVNLISNWNNNLYYKTATFKLALPANDWTFLQWKENTGFDTNSINSIPYLNNVPVNFIPASSSPCIGAGATLLNIAVDSDYYGNSREASIPDIGATEYIETEHDGFVGAVFIPLITQETSTENVSIYGSGNPNGFIKGWLNQIYIQTDVEPNLLWRCTSTIGTAWVLVSPTIGSDINLGNVVNISQFSTSNKPNLDTDIIEGENYNLLRAVGNDMSFGVGDTEGRGNTVYAGNLYINKLICSTNETTDDLAFAEAFDGTISGFSASGLYQESVFSSSYILFSDASSRLITRGYGQGSAKVGLNKFSFIGGKNYLLSFWVKGNKNFPFVLNSFYDEDASIISTSIEDIFEVENYWKRFTSKIECSTDVNNPTIWFTITDQNDFTSSDWTAFTGFQLEEMQGNVLLPSPYQRKDAYSLGLSDRNVVPNGNFTDWTVPIETLSFVNYIIEVNDSTFESSIGNWVANGTHSISVTTDDKNSGTQSLKVITASGVGAVTLDNSYLIPTVSGENYRVSLYARVENGTPVNEMIVAQNNRDFSSGTIGSWAVDNTGGNGTLVYEGTLPTGEKVGKVTVGSTPGTQTGAKLSGAPQFQNFTAYYKYTMSCDVWVPTGNSFTSIILDVGGDSPAWTISNTSGFDPVISGWQTITADFTATSDLAIFIRIIGDSTVTGDYFYFDNISLKQQISEAVLNLSAGAESMSYFGISLVSGVFTQIDLDFFGTFDYDIGFYLEDYKDNILYIDDVSVTPVGQKAHWVFDSVFHEEQNTEKLITQDLALNHTLTVSGWGTYAEVIADLTGVSTAYEGGNSLSFSTDKAFYIPQASCADLNPGKSDFSLIIRLKTGADITTKQYVLYKGAVDSSTKGYHMYIENGDMTIEISDGSGTYYFNVARSIDANKDYFIALSVDRDGYILLYFDDVLKSNTAVTNSIDITNSIDLLIGAGPSGDYLNGVLTEITYWNRAITLQEIFDIFRVPSGWTAPSSINSIDHPTFDLELHYIPGTQYVKLKDPLEFPYGRRLKIDFSGSKANGGQDPLQLHIYKLGESFFNLEIDSTTETTVSDYIIYDGNPISLYIENPTITGLNTHNVSAVSVIEEQVTPYGFWASYGGFSGTAQNPIISLRNEGMVVRNNLVSSAADWLGNNTISIGYTTNEWGIIGKDADTKVFELGSTNQIAGFVFNDGEFLSDNDHVIIRSKITQNLQKIPGSDIILIDGSQATGHIYVGSEIDISGAGKIIVGDIILDGPSTTITLGSTGILKTSDTATRIEIQGDSLRIYDGEISTSHTLLQGVSLGFQAYLDYGDTYYTKMIVSKEYGIALLKESSGAVNEQHIIKLGYVNESGAGTALQVLKKNSLGSILYFQLDYASDGQLNWFPGTADASADTNLYRGGVNQLKTDSDFVANDIQALGIFKSSDGSSGANTTINFTDNALQAHTVDIKDGIITSWTVV